MKIYTLSILAIAFLTFACGALKKTNSKEEKIAGFENIAKGDSLFASIYKSPCFGKCPNYKLSIYNSGFAILDGKRNALVSGIFTTHFTVDEMKQLLATAITIKYQDLASEYDNKNITDLPSTTTSIVINGKRKEVMCRIGCPAELTTFQNAFESFIKDKEWVAQEAK